MTIKEAIKFREWFDKQPTNVLTEVYMMLQQEYEDRGLNIETDRNFYSSEKDSSEQMIKGLNNHFDNVFDKHHGPGGF